MNFIKYCELPENEQWINDFLWDMKRTGFDADAIIDAVCEQADLEDFNFSDDNKGDDYTLFFSKWYDELDTDWPKSGAI